MSAEKAKSTRHGLPLRDLYLSGLVPKQGPNPPTLSTREVESRVKIMAFTGLLGKLCEHTAVRILDGSLRIDPSPELLEARQQFIEELKFVERYTFLSSPKDRQKRGYFNYQRYYAAIDPFKKDEQGRTLGRNEAVYNLLHQLDRFDETLGIRRTLGSSLAQTYDESTNVGGEIFATNETKHLIEAAHVLAKLICRQEEIKAQVPGTVIADVRIGGSQFDGIILPKNQPSFSTNDGFSANVLETENPQWGILEIKTLFKDVDSTGPNKLKTARRQDLAYLQQQLGRLALTWSDNHQGRLDFPFPQLIIIIYQRGTLPTVVQTIKLDYLFFRNWLDGQSFRFDAGLIAEQQRLEEIAQLHEILETALREERVHYEEEIRRRQSSAEDWRAKLEKGKPSQPNLF